MATVFVLLLVPSVAVIACLALALTIHLSTSKRHGKTPAKIHPRKAQIGLPRGGSSSCETCHMCGGLRLRSPNAAMLDDASSYTSPHFAVSEHVHHVQSKPPQKNWAAMKSQVSMSIKLLVQKLLSHQQKHSRGELVRSFKNLLTFLWCKASTLSKATRVAPTCVPVEECSSSSHAKVCTEGDMASEVVCSSEKSDNGPSGPCASLDVPSSETNFIPAGLDMVKARGPRGAADNDANVAAIHRLILEIFVSPSGNQDCRPQNGCSTSASALTLKLETNTARGHLSVCADALRSKASKCDLPQATCLPREAVFNTAGTKDQISQVSGEALWVPDAQIHCPSEKLKPLGNTSLDIKMIGREGCAGSSMLDLKDCGEICRSSHDNVGGDFIESVASVAAPGKQCIVMEQPKFSIGNHTYKNVLLNAAPKSSAEVKESLVGSEMASVRSLSGLGPVCMTLLKSDAREECAEKASCQFVSPLASLNLAGKPVGGSGIRNPKKEKLNTKARVFPETNGSRPPKSSARVGEGVGKMERGDQLFQAFTGTSSNDDFGSSSKKERRKKKSKGKKPKSKTGALMADSQEMPEIGKIALEAAKHVSSVPEREICCVCGALKGDVHNEACPYPFTSSGSMLQKKIKEQYNDLVRSNASRTLTLAQVGQFTSCLVEAKTTLQQKSESIQRKFTITKSLLSKADKSSFDRLCGQIYGLEMEQKKLEEDTVVYNRLQEQLKLSPAYKKMLEYGRAHFEVQPHTGKMIERLEPEDPEISFEEFLAQEKKDAFWQRHSLARPAVSAS